MSDKLKVGGLKEILYFKNKYRERENVIERASPSMVKKELATNIKAAERHPDVQRFKIEKAERHGEDVAAYTLLKTDGTPAAYFRAGQYVVIRQVVDGKLIARPVSISCGPGLSSSGRYRLTVKRVADGFLSGHILDNWKVGDEVETSGPQGTFYYEKMRDAGNVTAVAGGSGITPVLSMAEAIADGAEDFRLTVLYGSRTQQDVLFAERFAEIQRRTDKVRIINVLSEEEADGYEHGFVDAKLIAKYSGAEQYSIFAAGPMAMYRFLDKEVEKLGIPSKFYRKEIFGASKEPWKLPGYPPEAKGRSFVATVRMCGEVKTIQCSADETILTAFERAGIAGPNRCRGGVCGWCRSRLLSGDVYIPAETDGRRAADKQYGYIHPCASYAVSDIELEVPHNR